MSGRELHGRGRGRKSLSLSGSAAYLQQDGWKEKKERKKKRQRSKRKRLQIGNVDGIIRKESKCVSCFPVSGSDSQQYRKVPLPNHQGTLKKLPTELQCRNLVTAYELAPNMPKRVCNRFQLSFHFACHFVGGWVAWLRMRLLSVIVVFANSPKTKPVSSGIFLEYNFGPKRS